MGLPRGLAAPLPTSVARQVEERAHVLDQVRCLLVDRLGVGRTLEQIDPNAPLFAGGFGVDAAELDRHLEATFGVSLLDGSIVPRTVGAIVDLVLERMRLARHDSAAPQRSSGEQDTYDHGGSRG